MTRPTARSRHSVSTGVVTSIVQLLTIVASLLTDILVSALMGSLIRFLSQSSSWGTLEMRKLMIITSLMLALASSCTGQSANVQSGQVGVAAERDLVPELYQMYQSGQFDLGDNYFLMASFRILRDGSIPRESIHILHSSGSKLIDKKTFELLRRLGESHALRPLFA